MGLVITKTDGKTTIKNGSKYKIFTGPCAIDIAGEWTTVSSQDQTTQFMKSDVTTIGGAAPASGADAWATQLAENFPDASTGGAGGGAFAAMTGTEWNGFNEKTLSANLDVTIGTKASGILKLKNGGSYTFKVYGTAIVIRNSGTNGGRTTVCYMTGSDGKLWVESDADNLPIEITPPSGSNVAPVASSVAFTGTQTQGQTLTGTYSYTDADSDAEGASTFKWYRSNDGSGTGRAAISGATASTYVLQAGDVGKYIQFAVTPVAATGTTTGTEVLSSYSGAVASAPAGPTFEDITWTGGITGTQVTNTPHVYEADNSTGIFDGASVENKHCPAGVEGYYMIQNRPDLIITSVVAQWGPSPGPANYYAADRPMITINNNFLVGDSSLPGSYPGSMGYPLGDQAQDHGPTTANRYYGFHRHTNDDVYGCYSDDLVTITDVNLIGNYPIDLYPSTLTVGYIGRGYAYPKMSGHTL